MVVAGCYAQMEAEKIKTMQGVDLILGTNEKYKVFDYLEEEDETAIKIDKMTEFWGAATTEADNHTRAFLKIQDGCNYICSFCIIPHARGRSRTISIEDATNESKNLISRGFKEIVLTGVNIGEYANSSGERLEDLILSLTNIDGLKRLRLGSVEPNTMSESLVRTLKGSGVYQDHFHIPLQSGSDEILKSMRRKYDVAFYKETIAMVQSYFPDASFGADIIVGYPGESEEDFQKTYNLLKELPIVHFHVFPYSKRQKTTAAKLDNHIQADVKKARVKTLIALGESKQESFAKKLVGSKQSVLFENERDGIFEGYTSNYVKVRLSSSQNIKNQILDVKIVKSLGGGKVESVLT